MLKWLGILALFIACALLGIFKGAALFFRKKRLQEICLFIDNVADRIRVGEEMHSIIESAGGSAGFYKDGYNIFVKEDNLGVLDVKLATDFINGLGMGDTQSQLRRCETYSELFKRELKTAEKEVREKASVYGKLGIFLGLLIGIVLI